MGVSVSLEPNEVEQTEGIQPEEAGRAVSWEAQLKKEDPQSASLGGEP